MSERRERLVWMDLEMTGLDPLVDSIVQVAVVVTDIGKFDELDVLELPIWQPESRLEVMTPFVRTMHESSGLLKKVRDSRTSLLDAERALMKLIARWCGPQEGILAGNSIWQDRRFLARYMPALEGYLHFRQVDVTSFKILMKSWLGEKASFPKSKSHTALEDVRASIGELRFYKDRFGSIA